MGVAFASLVQGLPVDADAQIHPTFAALINPYTLLGGLATGGLFLLHGAAFLALKTEGEIRTDILRVARLLTWPVTGLVACFGIWTQLGYGKTWTWAVLILAVVAQLAAVALLHKGTRDGWAFISTTLVVVAVIVLAFGALFPNLVPSTLNPTEPDHLQCVLHPAHIDGDDLGGGHLRATGDHLPSLDVLGVPAAHLDGTHTRSHRSGALH